MGHSMGKPLVQVTLLAGLLLLNRPGWMSAQEIEVSGKACPFSAGQTFPIPEPMPSDLYFEDETVKDTMPPCIGVCSGSTISISADPEGRWGHTEGGESGPDGRTDVYDDTRPQYVALGGISRVIAPLNTLVGVFLTDNAPNPAAKPLVDLNLRSGDDMTNPALQQAFAIGSKLENVHVPEGATRLFLGLNDGYQWINNVGSVLVVVTTAVGIDIKPETLNLESKGEFTAFIDLPGGFDAAGVSVRTAQCAGAVAQKCLRADDGKLIVKFSAADLVAVSVGDAVLMTVTGELTDGTRFVGSDTIRVIDKGSKKK